MSYAITCKGGSWQLRDGVNATDPMRTITAGAATVFTTLPPAVVGDPNFIIEEVDTPAEVTQNDTSPPTDASTRVLQRQTEGF